MPQCLQCTVPQCLNGSEHSAQCLNASEDSVQCLNASEHSAQSLSASMHSASMHSAQCTVHRAKYLRALMAQCTVPQCTELHSVCLSSKKAQSCPSVSWCSHVSAKKPVRVF
eukprot:1158508-Pelagomonas_calceolata.AAC.26